MLKPEIDPGSQASNLLKAAILDELGRSTEVKSKNTIELNSSNPKNSNEDEHK